MGGTEASDLIVVGDNGAVARYSQGLWSELIQVTSETLNDVWVAPNGTAWAVGNKGTILRIDAMAP